MEDLQRIENEVSLYYGVKPELRSQVTALRAGWAAVNSSISVSVGLLECSRVNGPLYEFISIFCNDGVGNGLVLAFQLCYATGWLAVIGFVFNLAVLARHPGTEYRDPASENGQGGPAANGHRGTVPIGVPVGSAIPAAPYHTSKAASTAGAVSSQRPAYSGASADS